LAGHNSVIIAHIRTTFAKETKHSSKKQESPADARVTRDSAIIPRRPPVAILDFIEPQIAPFDPPTPKTLA